MKTLDQIAEMYTSKTLDGRELTRLALFVKFVDLPKFGLSVANEIAQTDWDASIVPFTEEYVIEQLRQDVEFGFEKALNQRGISSSIMFDVVKFWNWILENELSQDQDDYDNYPMYGLPLFKATALLYGFDNPIGDDEGTEQKYNE